MEFLYQNSIEYTVVTLVKYGFFLEFGIGKLWNFTFTI